MGLADESKESLYRRETDRAGHVDASRFFFSFLRTRSVGGGEQYQIVYFYFFPCSADHERD